MKKLLMLGVVVATTAISVDAAIAAQRCFQRQERICGTIGHPKSAGGQRVVCQLRTKMQCFQIPEIRNKNIGIRTFRKR